MPKILFAILSCHALRHFEQTQRNTWLRDIPSGDYKFFLGNPEGTADLDEVFLNVGDGFEDITDKTIAMYRWALERAYDFVFKADLDTFVRPRQLLQSDFQQYDYTGGQNSFFASGGAGYWLSSRALQLVVDFPYIKGPAEDVHTAQALQAAGISLHADHRYLFIPGQTLGPQDLTMHLSSVRGWAEKYQPHMMVEAYTATGIHQPLVTPQEAPKRVFRRLR